MGKGHSERWREREREKITAGEGEIGCKGKRKKWREAKEAISEILVVFSNTLQFQLILTRKKDVANQLEVKSSSSILVANTESLLHLRVNSFIFVITFLAV